MAASKGVATIAMKILFIVPNVPYPLDNGGRIRVYKLMESLAELGHEIDLLAFNRSESGPEPTEALQKICVNVHVVPLLERQRFVNKRKSQLRSLFQPTPYQYAALYSETMQDALNRIVQERKYDIIQFEFSQMGYHELPDYSNCVLDQHNVEAELLYRTYTTESGITRKLYSFVEWRKFQRDERAITDKFPICLTTSARDAEMLRDDAPKPDYHVIPNGVDCAFFAGNERTAVPDKNMLIFTGTIDYHPNLDGLKYFLDEVFPLIEEKVPDVKFYIVGRSPPALIQAYGDASENIIVTGGVEDMRPYFDKAGVVVVPLRIGGGTRLKILEAMAMSKPVVSTSIGAEGIDTTPGTDILLADEPATFAQSVVDLLADDERQQNVGQAGRRLVEAKYDWHSIAKKLEQTYENFLASNAEESENVSGQPELSRQIISSA